MQTDVVAGAPSKLVRRSALMVIGGVGATAALVILFLCMRSVMEIGGVCASGNTAFTPRVPCPSGVPGLMIGSIFLGLVAIGMYAVSAYGVNLVLLAWPALFLSLGWNFLDFGVNPPIGSGPSFGWLVCAVIFILMGGIPLVILIGAVLRGHESRLRSVDQARLRERLRLGEVGAPAPDDDARRRTIRKWGIGLQVASIATGIWAGIQLFEWATGSSVSIGFR
jgi:hypothetical protein